MDVVNIAQKLTLFNEHFTPKIVGEVNDAHVKLVKFKGEFMWHHHDLEDELFLVVKGKFTMRFRDKSVEIKEGEFLIVPHGVEHCPVAEEEVHIMLLEPKSTVNTGDKINDRTVAQLQWI
jgi:mannose-6-phosphate isomerase-like protein (cupin superfamily)